MGCSSSKRVEAAIDVYRPPPSSFAVFNINAIEEPWLKAMEAQQENDEKPTHVPAPVLEKLTAIEGAPRTWDEVSKALEDLKPTLQNSTSPATNNNPMKTKADQPQQPPVQDSTATNKQTMTKSFTFHTLEELDAKLSSKSNELNRSESMRSELKNPVDGKFKKSQSVKPKHETRVGSVPEPESRTGLASGTVSDSYKPVKDNIFILKDKFEREKEGKAATSIVKFDPLSDYPEKCPPEGADSVVIYTTSLGGVRRTFEDCNKIRSILEYHQVVFDERDVSLHGKFLNELKELFEEGATVPRMFVKGRYIGGVEEVVSLNEMGKLGRILNRARIERGVGRLACVGCGGARFVPCLDCGGSCKIVVRDHMKERCPKCNENGLVLCPLCA